MIPGCAVGCRALRSWHPVGSAPIRRSLPAESFPLRESTPNTQARINQKLLLPHIDAHSLRQPHRQSINSISLSIPPYPLSKLVVFDSLTRVKGNVEMISCASQNAPPSALAQLTIHPEREGGSRWRRKPDPSSMLGLIRLIDVFPPTFFFFFFFLMI